MAERRMFAKTIIDSDAFLDMPATSQCLYFHLGMRADDDGVVNNPRSIMRIAGCKDDDMKVLIAKKFVIDLGNQVVVIKHWKINNYIQKDRYKPSKYKELIDGLALDENGSYSTGNNECIQNVSDMDTQVSIGKVSIGKDSLDKNISYCFELPLIDGTLGGITQDDIDLWNKAYPSVDVMQELLKAKSWCIANPTRRKTKRGYKKFINSWLDAAQNNSRRFSSQNHVVEKVVDADPIESKSNEDQDRDFLRDM